MPSVESPAHSSSGITTSNAGDRHIPASVRADGSVRKEIKIRPGYKPPEDVEVYKNRTAESWKTRGSGQIPGAAAAEGADSKSTNNKNVKRRDARKRAKAAEETVSENSDQVNIKVNGLHSAAESNTDKGRKETTDLESSMTLEQPDPEAEKEKQARNLKKKLRQARELREKKEKGQNLLPEQFEKVIKINELIRQLDGLGLDAEGNLK